MTFEELQKLEGKVIVYRANGGDIRRVHVDNVERNIKNGRDGFDGTMIGSSGNLESGEGVWGYADQIM